MSATLAININTTRGSLSLTRGKLFRGGEYRLELTLDDKAVTDEVAMVRIYADKRGDTRGDEICIAEATASEGYVVKTDTQAVERVFAYHSGAEILPVRVVAYVTEAVVADGRAMLYWSPTMAIVDGKPIDTKGEKGDDGYTPVKGVDYFDGAEGKPGETGADGYTPKKGVDYFDGKDGEDGESAYQSAVKGGYEGDQQTFYSDLGKISDARLEAEKAAASERACEDYAQQCQGAFEETDAALSNINAAADVVKATAATVESAKAEVVQYASDARDARDEAEGAEIAADEHEQSAHRYAYLAGLSAYGDDYNPVDRPPNMVVPGVDVLGARQYSEAALTASSAAYRAQRAAETAQTAAETAKGQAEGFAKDASTSASDASTSAMNAKTSENNAKQTADSLSAGLATLNGLDGRVTVAEQKASKALPMGLGDWSAYNNKAYPDKLNNDFFAIPAPFGFIRIYRYKPSNYFRLDWVKSNGEVVNLMINNGDENHPWLTYYASVKLGWRDGNTVYLLVLDKDKNYYKVTILFADGATSLDKITSTFIGKTNAEGETISVNSSKYVLPIRDGFIINEIGEIYNTSTWKKTGRVSLAYYRIISPSSGDGVLARNSSAVIRITVDEQGVPTSTNVNTDKRTIPLSSGYACRTTDVSSNAEYTSFFACGGGTSNSWDTSIAGNTVPAIMLADIGNIVATPYGLFYPMAGGISEAAVGINRPLVIFNEPLYCGNYNANAIALKSGDDAYFVWCVGSSKYVLVSKEELV